MMSLLIPLLIFCVLLILNKQRARARQLPPAESWRTDALEAVTALVETATTFAEAPPVIEPGQTRTTAVPVATRAPDRHARPARYLLDGDDPQPSTVDRVARLQQAMRGPGLCSPRKPS